jgi:hypothetical protein
MDNTKFGHAVATSRPANACGCTGPRPGEPLCPCAMREQGIFVRDGRYIRPERDLGPATRCDCALYVRGATTGGWLCPAHGRQW